MNNKIMNNFDELLNENEEIEDIKCFNKEIPVENGDSVLFTLTDSDEVLLGKYVESHSCIITPNGSIIEKSKIDNWYHIPFNTVQEKLNTEKFVNAYNTLTKLSMEEYNFQQLEEYIENNVVRTMGTLDDDRQFLIGLFTRNVRNDKIDFKNYKFMIDILFNKDDIEYNDFIESYELKSICYNMYSIMNKISKETYENIIAKIDEVVRAK